MNQLPSTSQETSLYIVGSVETGEIVDKNHSVAGSARAVADDHNECKPLSEDNAADTDHRGTTTMKFKQFIPFFMKKGWLARSIDGSKMNAKFNKESARPTDNSLESEPRILVGSNCDGATIINSASTERRNHFGGLDPGFVVNNFFRASEGFGTRIQVEDNSRNVHIENSANDMHSLMSLQYYNEHCRGQEHNTNGVFEVPEDVHLFVSERLAANGLHYTAPISS